MDCEKWGGICLCYAHYPAFNQANATHHAHCDCSYLQEPACRRCNAWSVSGRSESPASRLLHSDPAEAGLPAAGGHRGIRPTANEPTPPGVTAGSVRIDRLAIEAWSLVRRPPGSGHAQTLPRPPASPRTLRRPAGRRCQSQVFPRPRRDPQLQPRPAGRAETDAGRRECHLSARRPARPRAAALRIRCGLRPRARADHPRAVAGRRRGKADRRGKGPPGTRPRHLEGVHQVRTVQGFHAPPRHALRQTLRHQPRRLESHRVARQGLD